MGWPGVSLSSSLAGAVVGHHPLPLGSAGIPSSRWSRALVLITCVIVHVWTSTARIAPARAGARDSVDERTITVRDERPQQRRRASGKRPGRSTLISVRDLTCDTLGGLERVRVADLGVCRLPVADLRTNTGSW